MKLQKLRRYFKLPFGSLKQYFPMVLENIEVDNFFLSIKPHIRKNVGLVLTKYYNLKGKVIKEYTKDYIQLRKIRVIPLYNPRKDIVTYFRNINPYITILSKYPYTDISWDNLPLVMRLNNNPYPTSLLYAIDVNKQLPDDVKDLKVYKLLRRLFIKYNHGELDNIPDNFIVTLINKTKVVYIPLIVDKDFSKFSQALSFLQQLVNRLSSIRKENKEEISDNELEVAAQEIFDDNTEVKDEFELEEQKEENTKENLKHTLKQLDIDNKDPKKVLLHSLIPDDNLVPKTEIGAKEVIKDIEILEAEPVNIDKDINPVNSSLDKNDILDNLNPTVPKRYLDYEFSRSIDTLVDLVNSYSSSANVRVLVDNVEILEPDEREVAPSKLIQIRLKFIDLDNNKTYTGTVLLPYVNEDGSILLNGKKWYIVNQLALLPITFPKKGVGKFTSLTSSFIIERRKSYTKILFSGGSFPITLLLSYLYGFDYVMKRYDIEYEIVSKPEKGQRYVRLTEDKYLVFPKYDDYDEFKQELIRSLLPFKNLHTKYSNEFEPLTKEWFGYLITRINESELILKYIDDNVKTIIDKQTYKILKERNEPTNLRDIMFYMFEKVVEGYVTDRNDLRQLRVRSYDQLVNVAFDRLKQELKKYKSYKENNRESDIKIDGKSILNSIVTSSAVRLMEYSNPLEEVMSMYKVTFSGYNGIPSEAVPEPIRGLHPTYYANIDPVDTPEGATTGVNQTFSIGASILTNYGAIIPKEMKDNLRSAILSLATASSPFVDKTEPTRGIMISNQLKQAVSLKEAEPPAVITGSELVIPYLSSDSFVKKSKCNGTVINVSDKEISIKCDDGNIISYDLSYKMLRSGQGYHGYNQFIPIVKKGQKVRKGQILTDSNNIKDGIMSIGRNFVTSYMFWKGYTYEDGIVVSEDVVDKLTSVHTFELFTYLSETDKLIELSVNIGDEVETGDVLIKAVSDKLNNLIEVGLLNPDEIEVIGNKYVIRAPYKGTIVDIKIYVNTPESVDPTILEKISKYDVKKSDEPYMYKGISFKGVFIFIYLKSEIPLQLGDKLTNRHAAKGVVCRIEPIENMPKLKDGRHVQIIINPLSVKNRTNMGQIYELYVGEISYQLGRLLLEKQKNTFIDILDKVLSHLDKTSYSSNLILRLKNDDKYYNELVKFVKKYNIFPFLAPPFKTPNYNDVLNAMKVLNIPEEYELILSDGTKLKAPTGIMYILKLEHMSSLKVFARSIGPYQKKFGQATVGKRAQGGQRLGELDFWALGAYDATSIIKELFSGGADDFRVKRQIYRKIITEGEASLTMLEEGEQASKKYLDVLLKGILLEK